jgi:hypothetical protein
MIKPETVGAPLIGDTLFWELFCGGLFRTHLPGLVSVQSGVRSLLD